MAIVITAEALIAIGLGLLGSLLITMVLEALTEAFPGFWVGVWEVTKGLACVGALLVMYRMGWFR